MASQMADVLSNFSASDWPQNSIPTIPTGDLFCFGGPVNDPVSLDGVNQMSWCIRDGSLIF